MEGADSAPAPEDKKKKKKKKKKPGLDRVKSKLASPPLSLK